MLQGLPLSPSSLIRLLPMGYCARQPSGSGDTMPQRANIPSVALIAILLVLRLVVHFHHSY